MPESPFLSVFLRVIILQVPSSAFEKETLEVQGFLFSFIGIFHIYLKDYLHFFFKLRNFFCYSFPYNVIVNNVIIMCVNISHSFDLPPRNVGIVLYKIFIISSQYRSIFCNAIRSDFLLLIEFHLIFADLL